MDQIEKYVKHNAQQEKYVRHFLNEFSDEIAQMHGKCIDIGCGPGSNASQLILPLLPVTASITGADVQKHTIEYAKKTHAGNKRVSFIELDIATDKLAPHFIGAFDNAISSWCINWCPQPSKAFKNIYNLLRPGGKALVLIACRDLRDNIYLKLYNNYPEYQPYMPDHLEAITYFQNVINPRAVLKKMIEECGFEVLHCSHREDTYDFDSFEAYAEHFFAVDRFMSGMPEDLRKKYEEDILTELLKAEYITVQNKMKESSAQSQQAVMFRYELLVAYIQKPELQCK